MIHIVDGQTNRILDYIPLGDFWDDVHRKSLKNTLETFDFTTFADKRYSQHLSKRNRIIIPDEDGSLIEFIIENTRKYRSTSSALFIDVYTVASYLELKKSAVIKPQKIENQTASTVTGIVLNGTEWRPGIIEGEGTRTFPVDTYTDPYSFTKTIATEFDLERRFRVEHDGNMITNRYLDLLIRIGTWQGREIEFGTDLLGIERKEDTSNIVTALLGLGPEREDGTRLEVLVTDEDALQRWGRRNPQTGELMHIIETYEPQFTNEEPTEQRLRELTQNELEKRVNSIVEYTTDIVDLETVPGLENKKIRFGDTLKIKDTYFNPPLYLEARVHTQERSLSDKSKKKVSLGDYIEYTEEEVQAAWKTLKSQIKDRLSKLAIVNISASAGTVFKNGTGETDLTAVIFLGGKEVDTGGTLYSYTWAKYDKNGNFVGATSGKSITVYAKNIDEKETYIVTVENEGAKSIGQITVTNVNDGEQGPPGQDGKSSYTHLAYANSADGRTDFSLTDSNREYIGMYVDDSPTNSTDPAKYKWTLVKGADGAQGIQGPPGADGRTPYLHIAYANSEDGQTGFSTTDSANKLYIGQYTDFSPADSTDPAKYSWTLIKGDKGEPGYTPVKGVDYFDGKDGQDGKSSYLWVRYSVNSNGNPMTDNPVDALYIGVATTTTPTAPTSYTAYKWSLIKGEDGIPGEKGQDGRTSYLHIRYSNDGGKTFTANNGETVGAWMGTYVDFIQADSTNPADYTWNKVKGEQGPQGLQGPPGADGKSLYTWVKYADDINGNGISDYPDGKKYIGLAYNKTTPTESTNPTDYTWALIQGPQGVKGTDGKTYYTWIKYADSPTSGMSDDPTGKKYMGIAYNKTTPTESANYTDYSWSLIQGPQGPKGDQGPQGPQGVQGPKGEDGQSLYTWIKYADSPTSGMSDTPDGKKYIGLAYNKTTPTESSNYADYQWSLIQGPQGVQGPKGADGVTTYTWVKYADDDRGNGMSDSPNGKRYLGLAYNKTTPTKSTNPADYSWSPLYDNVQVGGRNLIYYDRIGANVSTYDKSRYVSQGIISLTTNDLYDGVYITANGLEPNTDYVLSYKYKKTSGTLVSFGGHVDTDTWGTATAYVDGVRKGSYRDANSVFVADDENIHKVIVYIKTAPTINETHKIYIQPNRGVATPVSVEIYDWKLEKGNVATDWTPAPEDTQAAIDQAKRDAQNAQSTADGKNTVFYQATTPSTVGRKINDLWYDTDDGYKPYRFDGSNWIPAPFGNAAIANLDVGKIVGDQGNFNWLEAKHIKSLNGLNVGDGQFVVDANGNVKFAGDLTGASGTFSGTVEGAVVKGSEIVSEVTASPYRYRLAIINGVLTLEEFYVASGDLRRRLELNNSELSLLSNIAGQEGSTTLSARSLGAQRDFEIFAPEGLKLHTVYVDDIYQNGASIIASGNNVNGYWVRFADGTQICYAHHTITAPNANGSWDYNLEKDFPAAFVDAWNVGLSVMGFTDYHGYDAGDGRGTPMVAGNTVSATRYKAVLHMNAYVPSGNVHFFITAIGRWK